VSIYTTHDGGEGVEHGEGGEVVEEEENHEEEL